MLDTEQGVGVGGWDQRWIQSRRLGPALDAEQEVGVTSTPTGYWLVGRKHTQGTRGCGPERQADK